ncbi:hypothetical protein BST50_05340 [Vibrio vulnificus]|nr:hypothetical protein BST49_03590 [Vibrio vulnificus]PAO42032.1 hypothetical protein BST50_05340 [Vibrio vulnificus]PAO46796.1 hypothetical protein BST53_07770 [Vibrio vulnificus]PAO50525.1 hypothetical protein BST54_06215 [Vibrio vulnificus]PAO59712.1 hypothetical protein BST57_04880 [Vibrio vulnificus]
MGCFEFCNCSCTDTDANFDRVLSKETNFGFSLSQISKSNIGWFADETIADHQLELWGIGEQSGIYMLWHKEDYCAQHDRYHMTCLYVGKGYVNSRLRSHWKKKNFSDEMLIYFSYFPCTNRQAKYIEQLLLDLYDLPLNKAENEGQLILCQHWTQWDVD